MILVIVSILLIILFLCASIFWIFLSSNKMIKELLNKDENPRLTETYIKYYAILNEWLKNRNNGISISSNLAKRNIRSVAIYGCGQLGQRLLEELLGSSIQIKYFIDRNCSRHLTEISNIPLININDLKKQPTVDQVIVTPIYDFDLIKKELSSVVKPEIIVSLEEVILKWV